MSQLTLTFPKRGQRFALEAKRIRIPASIDWECPVCGSRLPSVNFADGTELEYELANCEQRITRWCDECEDEVTHPTMGYILRVDLQLVELK
jgi:hypothetical protein